MEDPPNVFFSKHKLAPANRRLPFPNDNIIKAEYGNCNDSNSCGDRHVLTVESGACRLWESYFTYKVQGQWHAYSTAAWNMRSNQMRPKGWTSADAAGLPILPLLMRAGEASAGEIKHALRITFEDSVLYKIIRVAGHACGGRRHQWRDCLRRPALAAQRLLIPSGWTHTARPVRRSSTFPFRTSTVAPSSTKAFSYACGNDIVNL